MTKVNEDLIFAVKCVLQLAESKWFHRAWKRHKLDEKQIKSIRMVSQWIDHRIPFKKGLFWIPTQSNRFIMIEDDKIRRCDRCNRVLELDGMSMNCTRFCCLENKEDK